MRQPRDRDLRPRIKSVRVVRIRRPAQRVAPPLVDGTARHLHLEAQTTARSGAWALLDDAKALAAAADLPGALRIYSNIGEPPTLLA